MPATCAHADMTAAAQQPGATPTQAQPQYQAPPQPAPQPSYATGPPSSYPPLPQPSNSGSVDLSNIKPVSSGSVTINDAIAKARAIAAERGLNAGRTPPIYGSGDSRPDSGRPYGGPRSRSRSPPARRDAFRDNNYNPYRDERRGDDRALPPNRGYPRDRSFSPGIRGDTFSPRGNSGYPVRERSPIGRRDDNSESIQVESSLVGLIIGKQGENLRRVEQETGCRVQFITGPDEGGAFRQCKITGPPARRAEAKAEINRVVEENGLGAGHRSGAARGGRDAPVARAGSNQPPLREGEDTMQIMVPDRTVGLIIGRGGETIRDLQERSGCHVNIVAEHKSVNGLRPVNLIGTQQAAAHAKDLIMEIVESDSKNAANKDRAAPKEQAYGGGPDKVNDSIFVPSEAVGMIIGKGGETIKDMQNNTGCKINVSPSSGPGEVEREIGLVGNRDAIERAKGAIMDKVDAVVSSSPCMVPVYFSFC